MGVPVTQYPQSRVAPAVSAETLLMLLALSILLFGAVLWADKEPQVEKTDFSVTYLSTQILRQGHAAKLYDLEEQKRVKATLYTHAEPLIFGGIL